MQFGSVDDAVAHLRAAVDEVLGCDMTGLDGVGVASLLAEIEDARRRLDAADTRALAVAEDRRVDGQFGAASLVDLLTDRLHLDAGEARRRVRRCEDLGPRHTLTGEPLPPILPATAAALADGEIHAGHVDVISRVCGLVDGLPDTDPDDSAVAETLLLDVARHHAPKLVARTGQELLARLDQDGTEPADQRIARRRGITFRDHPDGSSEWKVFADAHLTGLRAALFDTLAAPATDDSGEPDPRTPAQRQHDALADALRRVTRSGDLPVTGGVPTTVLAHLRLDHLPLTHPAALDGFEWDGRPDIVNTAKQQLTERINEQIHAAHAAQTDSSGHGTIGGYAVTSNGGLLSGRLLAMDMCEAEIDIQVSSPDGAVLAFGRSTRLATRAQRIALAGRDGGCCFPGCTRPPSWCEAHHVIPWSSGGRTDINNLCLVCPYHHRQFEQLGWTVRMNRGVPEWTPPPWIDSEQKPIRNRATHLLDFEFHNCADPVLV
jgi:hypothetical protein